MIPYEVDEVPERESWIPFRDFSFRDLSSDPGTPGVTKGGEEPSKRRGPFIETHYNEDRCFSCGAGRAVDVKQENKEKGLCRSF
jgi:hypothetical protein